MSDSESIQLQTRKGRKLSPKKWVDKRNIAPPVRTTDGFIMPWSKEKIAKSLMKETKIATEIYGIDPMSSAQAFMVAEESEKLIKELNLGFLSGSLIREIVNIVLLKHGFIHYYKLYTRVGAPLYEVYKIEKASGFEAKENSNLQPNPETIHKKKADLLSKEAAMLLLPSRMSEAHLSGDFHIHDLEYFTTRAFCQDWDLRYFFKYGLMPDGRGIQTSIAGPAKHAEVAILHAVKIWAAGQTNFAGGQGHYGFNFFIAPYLRGLDDKRLKQLAQMLLYEATQAYVARGGQLVFSSIQLEAGVPKIWQNKPVVYKGKVWNNLTYGDFEEEAQRFASAIFDVYYKGDSKGKMFNFPKPEVVLRKKYFKDPVAREILMKSSAVAAKFGSPYYDNLVPEYRGGDDGVSCYQCCAYCFSEDSSSENFEKKMYFEDGAHFSLGGMQVVSMNLPRLAYKARGDDDKLIEELRRVMELARDVLMLKRRLILNQANAGLIPFATQRPNGAPPVCSMEDLALVIGLIGMNEMVQYHTGYQLHESPEAVRLGVRLAVEMERIKNEFIEATGMPFSVSRTPAESSSQRLAIADLIHYPAETRGLVKGDTSSINKIKYTRDLPLYYSNGTHAYVGAKIPLSKKVDIEQKFFPILSGGNIFHIWLGERNPDPEVLMNLTEKISKSWVGYYAFTKDLTNCTRCNTTVGGMLKSCPNCGATDVGWYSRVTGYYQNVKGWNEGKKAELVNRWALDLN
jgi:ribonucleoside-triphosphate reductase